MNNESKQVSNLPALHSKFGIYSFWLGVASIALFVVGRVFVYGITGPIYRNLSDTSKDLVDMIETLAPALSLICGLLAILIGRIAQHQNKKSGGNQKDKAAQAGTVLGILAFIPACLFLCGFLLAALATGY